MDSVRNDTRTWEEKKAQREATKVTAYLFLLSGPSNLLSCRSVLCMSGAFSSSRGLCSIAGASRTVAHNVGGVGRRSNQSKYDDGAGARPGSWLWWVFCPIH